MTSDELLRIFAECVRRAPDDPEAEKYVRGMLEGIAGTCPMDTLVRLGLCLADCRRDELRAKAQQN